MHAREQVFVGSMSVAYAFSLTYIGGPSNLQLILASLLLVAACCYKFLPALSGKPFQWGIAFTLMSAYLAWLVILVYTSTLPENSVHFAWLLSSFVLVALLGADMETRSWFMALALFAITGLVSAVWGIGQFAATSKRASGPIVDPSSWCAIDNLFLFAMVYALLAHRRLGPGIQALLLVTVALFATAAFSSYSRVGTAITFIGIAFVVAVCVRYRLGLFDWFRKREKSHCCE